MDIYKEELALPFYLKLYPALLSYFKNSFPTYLPSCAAFSEIYLACLVLITSGRSSTPPPLRSLLFLDRPLRLQIWMRLSACAVNAHFVEFHRGRKLFRP